jgi:murein DD-endopeptidase MepM/ murein hydrolase activator NlpD
MVHFCFLSKSLYLMKKRSLLFAFTVLAFVSFSFARKPSHKSHGHTKRVSKSLDFPVAGVRSNIGGFWGDSRDGGVRKHKGIDIFAKKGTPVVAVSDGVIVKKAKTPIGGKTLWLKPSRYTWTAYYAHLDKQLVKRGQRVHKGQVIGTVGNTGNARTTPSHLHFGIRPGKGWVNPLPYVNHSPKVVAAKTKTGKKRAKK